MSVKISELPTQTAISGNDYLVGDNGTDTTYKFQVSVLEDEVNAAIEQTASDAVASVNTAKTQAVSAVGTKGDEVLDSIPDDYTTLSNDVTQLKNDFINKTIAEYGLKDIGTLTSGRYVLQTTGSLAPSSAWSYSNFVPINGKAILFTCPLSTNNTQLSYVAAIAFYSALDANSYLSNQPILNGTIGTTKWLLVSIPEAAKYIRVSVYTASASSYQMVEIPFVDPVDLQTQIDAIVGEATYTTTFTAAQQNIHTGIQVKANTVYHIEAEPYTTGTVNESRIHIYVNGDASNYGRIFNDFTSFDFIPLIDGELNLYNYGGYVGDFTVTVTSNLNRAVDDDPVTYYVTNQRSSQYTSLTALLLQLKDDKREKTIIIEGGDYDIFQEYKDLQTAGKLPTVPTDSGFNYSTGYIPYNVFVPDNTHIIGRGLVRLIYRPTTEQTTPNESKTLSPLNVAGSMTIENVEIYGKNCRYCIHDDPLQDASYNGAIKKYVNVKAVKEVSDSGYGYKHCVGTGVSKEMTYIYDGCTIENRETTGTPRTLYFHDRSIVGGVELNEQMSSRIIVKDSVIIADTNTYAVFFGNIGTTNQLHIKTDIENCYVGGAIISADEGNPADGNNQNSFDIKVLFSKYVLLRVRNENNIYPPQIFEY